MSSRTDTSKFKKDSFSASTLHDVVSQALKNIGRVNATVEEFKNKYNNSWKNEFYKVPKKGNIESKKTKISLVRKGNDWEVIKNVIEGIYSNPNYHKRIFIAMPSFTKEELQIKLEKTSCSDGNLHEIQLLWLLSSFISTCQDYGVEPYLLTYG
ncbi:hypothetical protein K4L44_05775 [Halosquirtibacter laminarini]|uniref:Uncharacterized protein n=1 Tax=Halosquirtibacter laminarini TaxID=3374600 RepID=A0AC61NI25_9BACT|nr:hypothetical protein K4L44_05775 [Prolixibacteraceae bacterium]